MTSKINLSFYKRVVISGKSTLQSVTISPVVVQGIGQTDFLYPTGSDTAFSKISLPLAQMNDTSVFNINLHGWADQLNVVYKRKNVFVNYDCGFRTEYILDTVWFSIHPQDTILINQTQRYVSTSLLENCKILLDTTFHLVKL
jgi:hypothetical protein